MAKKGKRYTEQERARILAAADKQGLNGVQAAKKFGISTLTYYTWKKRARAGTRTRRAANGPLGGVLRAEVRAALRRVLPAIVRDEIINYLRTAGLA